MKFTQFFPSLLLVIALLLFSQQAQASHAMGADLTYQCIGPNQYEVQLSFYRDCGGISPSNSYPVSISSASCGVSTSVTVTLDGGYPIDITPLCPSEQSNCSGNGTYGVEQYNYTGTITLPSGCSDWEMGWSECCRNNAITTLNDPGSQSFYVEAQLDGTVTPCNSSPVFNNIPTPFTCVGDLVNYNHGVSDPDGDDLVFSLANCQEANNDIVNYAGGFSGANPLTATGLTIDPATGAISFTPTATQVGVLCIRVEEYRNGVKIGEVVRDMQFTVINCSNQAPTASGTDSPCDPSGPSGSYELDNCAGETICFDVLTCDNDGDNVTVTWNQGVQNGSLIITGNGTNAASAQFCWTPTSNDIGINFFTVTVQDDACPIIGSNTFTYTIEITGNPNDAIIAGADQSICLGESAPVTATPVPNIVSYDWLPVDGLVDPSAFSTIATPTQTTTYTITATYVDGCQDQDYLTVTVLDDPSVSVFPETVAICTGGSASFTASTNLDPVDIGSIEWFEDPTGANTSVGFGNIITVTPPATTDYEVVVTSIDGCSSSFIATASIDDAPPLASCVNIYVTNSALAAGAGTQTDPTSLDQAISMAACNDAVIKIAGGTYNIDNAINLRSLITLEGGFDGTTWTKSSTAGLTTINRTANNIEDQTGAAPRIVAFYGNNVSNFRLQDITITTDDAPSATGTNNAISTYGLHLTSAEVYNIIRCQIYPGNGGMGVTSSSISNDGSTGANGSDSGGQSGGLGGGNGGNGGSGGDGGAFSGDDGNAGSNGTGTNPGSGSNGNGGGVACGGDPP
ncbi:MAG: hypothetical protein ACI94Y_000710, partial [Maribacter sp.]